MNGKFATLLGATSAMGFFTGTVMAHPGHSPADVTAQLAAPLAGPDHFVAFTVASVLGVLAAARLALHLVERQKRARATTRRR
jgi:hypothetical protein